MAKYKFTGVVYSTNPDYKYQSAEPAESKTLPPQQQDLRVWLEKGGRGGKQASVIKGFVGTQDDLEQLARELKTHCATGGSAKDGEIIIQGDNRDKIVAFLQKKLFKVKKPEDKYGIGRIVEIQRRIPKREFIGSGYEYQSDCHVRHLV